jgi:hypothetical protein
MSSINYLEKEGSLECLALLLDGKKGTPELIKTIDTSENTIRNRLDEGVEKTILNRYRPHQE